jgi:hypothetical protein
MYHFSRNGPLGFSLLTNVVGVSGYVASTGRVINELKGMWKEALVA